MKHYGFLAIGTYIILDIISLTGFYVLVKSGVDVEGLLESKGIHVKEISWLPEGSSTFVIALTAHKLFSPLRIFLSLAIIPSVAKIFQKLGLIKLAPKPTLREVRENVKKKLSANSLRAKELYLKRWKKHRRGKHL
ncbi:protein FAM210B, mitochondrial-like [Zophobas morio]|uniref:protein FAM210B, mitochondrial-like n=1 Tax=Zophobas morio TaxID=2755281 RepID=UPI003083E741